MLRLLDLLPILGRLRGLLIWYMYLATTDIKISGVRGLELLQTCIEVDKSIIFGWIKLRLQLSDDYFSSLKIFHEPDLMSNILEYCPHSWLYKVIKKKLTMSWLQIPRYDSELLARQRRPAVVEDNIWFDGVKVKQERKLAVWKKL